MILKTAFVLFCTHRGTVCMQVSSFLLSPYLGPLHKVCQFLFPVLSHCKTSHRYHRRQSSVLVKKYVLRRYCFSDQTHTLQVAHSHATKQISILNALHYYFLRYFLPYCKNIRKLSSDQYEGSTLYQSVGVLKKVSMHK